MLDSVLLWKSSLNQISVAYMHHRWKWLNLCCLLDACGTILGNENKTTLVSLVALNPPYPLQQLEVNADKPNEMLLLFENVVHADICNFEMALLGQMGYLRIWIRWKPYTKTSWHRNVFHITSPWRGKPPVTDGFPSQRKVLSVVRLYKPMNNYSCFETP